MLLLFFTILFLVLLYLPIHSYIVYPIIIFITSKFYKTKPANNVYPEISILISAYNEEKVIKERIQNIVNLDYDHSKMEVLVGTDCCSDNTLQILQELEKQYSWLRVYEFVVRRGKAAVLNDLVKLSKYDTIVFSDANTIFGSDAVKRLMQGYYDETVGGVSGHLLLKEPKQNFNKSNEEKSYWQYETQIKKAEGRCGILIGANGGIFTMRKKYFKEIPCNKPVTDDFYMTLSVLAQGKKFLFDHKAIGAEEVAKKVEFEFKRKVRFSATNFQTLKFTKSVLFNKNFLLSFAYLSHKVIRWFLPIVFILLFIINIFLIMDYQYFMDIFLLQSLFYFTGFIGFLLSKTKIRIPIFSLPYFFIMTNFALLLGWIRFLRNKHTIIWQSTPR